MTIRSIGLLAALTLGCISVDAASAQTIRSVRITADNDIFNFWLPLRRRPDVAYTHGTHIRFELGVRPWWDRLLGTGDPVCDTAAGGGACVLTELEFGQELYTPFRDAHYPRRDDRPYAGWLYLAVTGRRVRASGTRALGVQLGVTGQPSLAEQAQELVHNWFDLRRPLGWDYQIPFEPGVAVRYEEARVWPVAKPGRAWSFSLEPAWGAAVGNVRTSAHAELGVRLALNAARPVGWRSVESHDIRVYVEATARGSLVLRDLFLDGSTWGESARVEKEPFVPRAEVRVGFGLSSLDLEYRVVHSGRKFRGQPVNHTYSSIVLVVRP